MQCQIVCLVVLHVVVNPLLVAAHVGVDPGVARLGAAHPPADQAGQHHAVVTPVIARCHVTPPGICLPGNQ